jgi:hypothetical protein
MWATSLAIADSAYVLLVIVGGVIVMGHETLQTSYSAKDIAPRLVTGFLAANLSLVVISQATSIANALSAALAGDGFTPATAASAVLGTLTAPFAFYAAVMSRVSPLLRRAAGARRPPSAAGGRGRGPTGPRGAGPGGGGPGRGGPGGGGRRGPAAPPGGGPGRPRRG